MTTTLLPKAACPTCRHVLDAVTPAYVVTATPRPGDLTICLTCAEVLILDQAMVPRVLADDERAAVYADQPGLEADVEQARRAVLAVKRKQ